MGLSFKEWSVDLRRWIRASWLTPDVRILKILEALPKHIKGIFQNVPDAILFGPDGMSMVMSQVQIHCGLRPEDEKKDVMNASMDTKRKANESITTWLCRVQQAWMIAEINQVCTNPDATKIWLLEQGARLSPTQAQQFNTLMMNHENDLRYAEKTYLVVDRVAEPDGKKS